jgi:hypothetical protein
MKRFVKIWLVLLATGTTMVGGGVEADWKARMKQKRAAAEMEKRAKALLARTRVSSITGTVDVSDFK